MHNEDLDEILECLEENPKILDIKILQKKQSFIVNEHYNLPFIRKIAEGKKHADLSEQQREIVLGAVDKFYGRLARLSIAERNWANHDRSYLTDFQNKILMRISAILDASKSVDDVEENVHLLIPQIKSEARDQEELTALLSGAHLAIESFRYWHDEKNRRRWDKMFKARFSSLSPTPIQSAIDTTGADVVGGVVGGVITCLGCGYFSGGTACVACGKAGGEAAAVSASFTWVIGNSLFD